MSIIVASKNNKRVFNQEQITIGSDLSCDYVMSIGENFLITLHYREDDHKCVIVNSSGTKKILYRNVPFGERATISTAVKFEIADSDDYLILKIADVTKQEQIQREAQIAATPNLETKNVNINQSKLQAAPIMNNSVSDPKELLELRKKGLEEVRTTIVKETGFATFDLKKRISLNTKSANFVNIGMLVTSFVSAFGVSNYLTGLKIEETSNFIQLPININIYILFGIIISALAFVLKQGIFLLYQNKSHKNETANHAQSGLIITSTVFFIAIYVINLLYYINLGAMFAILISAFFVGLNVIMAYAGGYFKNFGHSMSYVLDQYEYREDFEAVMHDYRNWIEKFINNLSQNKLENLKDRLFNLQLKSAGEMLLGILTAPFLAYGVSNTLAQCFPEAAGWVRISGLRFSPVFLVLATFLIIFAFLAFTSAFVSSKKIQGSSVIKQDGFSDYLNHGVNILGLQAVRKLESEKVVAMSIACAIIFIEFTMNVSYFMTNFGDDLQSILLCIIAALVPTALLIAETFMLSQTKFEISAIEDLMAKLD